MPGGAFTPYPSAWAEFAADPANARALQGYQQVMAMMQQAGGFMPFAYPGMTPPIMPPPVLTPSTFVPRMVHVRPVNLTGIMNEAAPSNVHEVDEAEQEAARRRKGKAIAKPSKTRDSAFKRLGDKEDGPRKSAKLRLGPEMGRTSAMERLCGNRPVQSRRSRESETIHLDEKEAESQPRASAYTRLSYDEDDLDKIESVARKLRALEEKVEEKTGAKKHTLAKSPFSARVHAQKLRRKVKLDVEKFTGKEDPNVHLDTFHNAAQMAGCTDAEECLLFFSSLRGRPVEWFNGLPHGKIGSFEKLAEVFRKKYQDNCIKRKKFTYLNMVGQRERESLTQFLTRWRDEVDKVEEMDDKTAMSLLMSAFRSGDLYTEFCRRPPSSYQEAYNTAWEYAEAEVLNNSKRELEEGYTRVKADKPKDDQMGGLAPKVVTVVEQDLSHAGSFLGRFVEAIHYYSALFDSLGACYGEESEERHAVEQQLLSKEIRNVLAVGGPSRTGEVKFSNWREKLQQSGFRGVSLAGNAAAQATLLLGMFNSDGYTLAEDNGALKLGWKDLCLLTASAWRPPPLQPQ
ncbi:unnamed protein product [Cuscuta campestris]|uniref:Retrotransposon gag domain-containing protein n=1 Tax=Cuscuta campestris TaxID=132261 RepID=A0A484MSG1_9ASTE|nr:unnamed protein product [Cuscuta campestris]